MKHTILVFVLLSFTSIVHPQTKSVVIENTTSPSEALARKAFEAHGGKKLKEMKTLSVTGPVDVTSSAANQALPASFVQVFSGDKYRLEVDGGIFQFVQTFDGVNTVTSPSRGFTLPPINRIGLLMLQKFGQEGFVVAALIDEKKEGFRMTSPEGYYTDFYLDKKTSGIKSYDSSYVVAGRQVTTLVEVDKYKEFEGIAVPSKFAQRFEVSGMTIYALFKSKEIVVNGEVSDDLFGSASSLSD